MHTGGKLIILDDMFPLLATAFRIAEYNGYLEAFPGAEVHSTASSFHVLKEKRSFGEVRDEYARVYPQYRDRIFEFDASRHLCADLIYVMFLHNATFFIDWIEEADVPFVFTLYPGGKFYLNQSRSDLDLRRICYSPNLAKVIVTQKITRDYLLEEQFCPPEKIAFIFGGVLPSEPLTRHPVARKYWRRNKTTFDICFVANKYTPRGVDKGYDVFVEVAKALSKRHADILFHVVGPFDASDIDVGDLGDRITFYGPRYTDFFPEFHSRMDIILSPNAPFVLRPGAFDGFPTGCCIEAGLCGVAVFCTDVLHQNIAFNDGEEIVLIPRDPDGIVAVVNEYYGDYDRLRALADRGQKAFQTVFGLRNQMEPRLRLLAECLAKGGEQR